MKITIDTTEIVDKFRNMFAREPSLKDRVDELSRLVAEMKAQREAEEAKKAKEG